MLDRAREERLELYCAVDGYGMLGADRLAKTALRAERLAMVDTKRPALLPRTPINFPRGRAGHMVRGRAARGHHLAIHQAQHRKDSAAWPHGKLFEHVARDRRQPPCGNRLTAGRLDSGRGCALCTQATWDGVQLDEGRQIPAQHHLESVILRCAVYPRHRGAPRFL